MADNSYKWTIPSRHLVTNAENENGYTTVSKDAYYPHFYSGSDAFFFIVNNRGQLIPMPIVNFGYGVSQEKVPLFGAWDYKFRAVARGTRIVRGEFTIVFTRPNWISAMIMDGTSSDYQDRTDPLLTVASAKQADVRDQLRAQMWGWKTNKDKDNVSDASMYGEGPKARVQAYPFGRDPIGQDAAAAYAGHPAFDIMISHGNNPDYTFDDPNDFNWQQWTTSVYDHMKYVQSSPNEIAGTEMRRSERVYIESVELMSSGIAYDVSGQPLVESYSFIARDVTTPQAP